MKMLFLLNFLHGLTFLRQIKSYWITKPLFHDINDSYFGFHKVNYLNISSSGPDMLISYDADYQVKTV